MAELRQHGPEALFRPLRVADDLDPSRIPEIADAIGADQREHSIPPSWDDQASERIADVLVEHL